jgi:uncharacterized membrane protein YhhN
MVNILILVTAAILLPGLLYYEKKENIRGRLPTKTLLSCLFVVAILVQPHLIKRYYQFLLAGLICCMVGDVCLAFPREKMFLSGLISFLLGHVFYLFGFFHVSNPGVWSWPGSIIILFISIGIYLRLKSHLGSMRIPVLLYIAVITAMVSGAWSVFTDSGLLLAGRIMVMTGALLFYISDVFVARDRFLKKEFLNKLIGLPLYFAGQFILAFSVGVLQ